MLLIGFTGLVSLGHGAFMAIGAYTNTYLITKGVPFLIAFPVAGLAALLAGILIAVPANRMSGIYLAIATLAFSQIVEQVIIRWESVTRGFQGMPVPPPDLLGHAADAGLAVLLLLPRRAGAGGARRRQPDALADGARAWSPSATPRSPRRASASTWFRYKTIVFALSAGITGLAGALLAHKHALHLARRLQHPAVDPAAADGGGGRARLDPRRHPGRHLRRRRCRRPSP